MAVNRGVSIIMVESDAEVVIKSINGGSPVFPLFGQFIEGNLELATGFSICSFAFRRKLGNKAAHGLARLSLTTNDNKHWICCFPESISDQIHMDVEHCNFSNE